MVDNAGRRFTDETGKGTTVAAGSHVDGTVSGDAPVDVAGTVTGNVTIKTLVWIREGGAIEGGVEAEGAVIEGRLDGTLEVSGKVELRATSKVRGDIRAGTVAIADGAFFEGRIEMSGGGGPGAPTTFREKRRPA